MMDDWLKRTRMGGERTWDGEGEDCSCPTLTILSVSEVLNSQEMQGGKMRKIVKLPWRLLL